MASLRGDLEQTPPMYSAKKLGGRKLYELARRGEEVERRPVRVTVSEFELSSNNGSCFNLNNDGTTDLRVRVVCSAGTYIRTLAEDLGKQLGVGAHLVELRRTRAGCFEIAVAITLEHLAELSESKIAESRLITSDAALSHLPAIELTTEEVTRTIHGIDMAVDEYAVLNWEDCAAVRMRGAGNQLIAVGSYDESRKVVHPKVVIANG